MTYTEWFQKILFMRDKVILPDGKQINKLKWVTPNGFNINEFNKFLMITYNELQEKKV